MKIYRLSILQSRKFWQAPNGDLVFVDAHSRWQYDGKNYQYGRDNITGWVRGEIYGNQIVISRPTVEQLIKLKELARSQKKSIVYYDSNDFEKELYNPLTDAGWSQVA